MDGGRPGIGPARGPRVPTVPRPRRAPLSESRPHPTDGGVVGTYVHPYDPSPQPYPSPIPAMRPAQDGPAGFSATPIFDALYSEYRRSFRTLPGDRSGEEQLAFRAFGTARSTGLSGFSGVHGQPYAAYPPAWPAQQHHPPQAALPPGPRRSP
ncbi:hypothetical protein Shyd_32410 [Streptomyces hydrogenans]|uniref:Uncharacterized protein n=3 Tax=Streptomyces TaxID=1883 RepID=A0ABQ3PA44_9ACTN|nr:hypothetical protein GCM10018784_51540 [Streptomyces hydrogenans]GHI21870.1 hypothetical protein Shyd_32410 [Streptomyces hydrogenans]